MSDDKTIEERLADQLNEKDREIERLERKLEESAGQLKAALNGWCAHVKMPKEQTLPLPRLEIEVVADGSQDAPWYSRIYYYRLVYMAFWGDVMGIPLGETNSKGGNGNERPIPTEGPNAGRPEMPFRDGAHICYDMAALKLPGFLICEDVVADISHLAGRPQDR